jgi:hypothetical protein
MVSPIDRTTTEALIDRLHPYRHTVRADSPGAVTRPTSPRTGQAGPATLADRRLPEGYKK